MSVARAELDGAGCFGYQRQPHTKDEDDLTVAIIEDVGSR